MKVLMMALMMMSFNAISAVGIRCEPVENEDNGVIEINFTGDENSAIKNISYSFDSWEDGESERYSVDYAYHEYSQTSGWPLGYYDGLGNSRPFSVGIVVKLHRYSTAHPNIIEGEAVHLFSQDQNYTEKIECRLTKD